MNQRSKNIAYGLVGAALLLLICILIRPAGLTANDGLSYFGGLEVTVVPYSIAFLLNAFFYWKTAELTGQKDKTNNRLSLSLKIMAILLAGLVVTPHNIVNRIHVIIGSILFSFQLVFSLWLVSKLARSGSAVLLFIIEFLSGVAAFYYVRRPDGLLLQSQVVFQLAFGLLLINALNKLRRN